MRQLSSSSGNPLLQALAAVGGLVVFATALFVGTIVFLVLLGVASVAVLAFYLRLRWLTRQRRADSSRRTPGRESREGDVIEGDYRREPPTRDR